MSPVRVQPSILHIDLDAFFAAVEQRDKPSLRGKPVIVGGTGPRGVVATASYEARTFGIRSAMSAAEARSRCGHAAFLSPRFAAYQQVSKVVMGLLAERSPLVEPLSLDEAFVDLAAGDHDDLGLEGVRRIAEQLRRDVQERTGLTASVGAATTKLLAKIASDLDKPDGLVMVEPGSELALLAPMPVRTLWGVGPATAERLVRLGVHTVHDLRRLTEDELVASLGQSHGTHLYRLARARDERTVSAERDTKSVSVEDTFDVDVKDRGLLGLIADRMAHRVGERLAAHGLSGRTVTLKVRLSDFTTLSRSVTLPAPSDDARVLARLARRLLDDVEVSAGIRLLGVGVSGLADWVQEDLFTELEDPVEDVPLQVEPALPVARRWLPGQDVEHAVYGRGWVWGSGLGRVTVRFETRESPPGPVRTLPLNDPDLRTVDLDA